jgi:hypothetical protein
MYNTVHNTDIKPKKTSPIKKSFAGSEPSAIPPIHAAFHHLPPLSESQFGLRAGVRMGAQLGSFALPKDEANRTAEFIPPDGDHLDAAVD